MDSSLTNLVKNTNKFQKVLISKSVNYCSDALQYLIWFSINLGFYKVNMLVRTNLEFWKVCLIKHTIDTILLSYLCIIMIGAPKLELEIPLSCRLFAKRTPRNCLKFMFTQSIPNRNVCQIDHSRNNAIFSSNSRFHALKYVESQHHGFPLGVPIT